MMRYVKMVTVVVMVMAVALVAPGCGVQDVVLVMAVALAPWYGVQDTGQDSPIVGENLSPKQFQEAVQTALHANDAIRIRHLIIDNPKTADQVQQRLMEQGKGTGEAATRSRALADYLEQFRTGDFSVVLVRLDEEARRAYGKTDYATALKKWELGLNQARALGDKRYIGWFLTSLGNVYTKLEQHPQAVESYKQAVEYLEQALAIARESGERWGEGILFRRTGQYETAMAHFDRAKTLFEAVNDKEAIGHVAKEIGIVYDYQRNFDMAMTYYTKALTISEELGDLPNIARTANNIGIIYTELKDDYDVAMKWYNRGLQINKKLDIKLGIAKVLNNMGESSRLQGNYNAALAYYTESLTIHEELGAKIDIAIALGNAGHVYKTLEDYDRAITYYDKAVAIARELER
jgi:tetratricopeptide (TPR) repeat protein